MTVINFIENRGEVPFRMAGHKCLLLSGMYHSETHECEKYIYTMYLVAYVGVVGLPQTMLSNSFDWEVF